MYVTENVHKFCGNEKCEIYFRSIVSHSIRCLSFQDSFLMFDRAVTDAPAAPTVIQALTSGLQNKNRRSRRDNGLRNPRKMHEEVGKTCCLLPFET